MEPVRTNAELLELEGLRQRLAEAEQLIEAIKQGEVDAFAIGTDNKAEIYTLQSGDYAYRVLIEEFGEGALNITEDGLIVYTNRCFFEMVKLPYESVIGSYIFDYLHPDSVKAFKELFSNSLKGKSKGEVNLSVNGLVLPVYISLTSLQPNLPTVGIIITDLTEKKKHESVIRQYQRNLEEKNNALMQSNTELGSFAYIASHDLQEPLRKIQTFSSHILDREGEHFAEETKDYFRRIVSAAKRMQSLIIALLEYSRLTENDVNLIPTDLNVLVADVRLNLAETIAESKSVITVSSLPVIPSVPYQIVQLFTNIILNAIKYKRPYIDPVIEIRANRVDSTEIRNIKSPKQGNYWEISVSDNGIGFDMTFAEKIFELFQRLHRKNEYEGTGIGLAICRKILQNHNGYITAAGQPGAGSTFYIYFPLTPNQDAS